MGAAVAFSGVMFSRLGTLLPGARSFDDLGAAAFGRRGRILAFCTVNVAIFAAPALLHLTCAESLQQIFAHQGLTHTQAILIIAVIIIPLTQVYFAARSAAFACHVRMSAGSSLSQQCALCAYLHHQVDQV